MLRGCKFPCWNLRKGSIKSVCKYFFKLSYLTKIKSKNLNCYHSIHPKIIDCHIEFDQYLLTHHWLWFIKAQSRLNFSCAMKKVPIETAQRWFVLLLWYNTKMLLNIFFNLFCTFPTNRVEDKGWNWILKRVIKEKQSSNASWQQTIVKHKREKRNFRKFPDSKKITGCELRTFE